MTAGSHGQIAFASRTWKSPDAQPISISLHGSRYEAMFLLGPEDWIKTDLGLWSISNDGRRLGLGAVREVVFG
jgi:hypothetical protein